MPLFETLSEAGIATLLDATRFEKYAEGAVLCRQGEVADAFYILVVGSAVVSMAQPAPPGAAEKVVEIRVGSLAELDFFGEACLEGRSGGDGAGEPVRTATVTARSTPTSSTAS